MASQVVAVPEQVSCEVGGDVAILSLANGVYYGLNPVGARIWQLIQQPIRVGDVLETLLAEYEVDEASCKSDLLRVLGELAGYELVALV
jgi:hypothetical protein